MDAVIVLVAALVVIFLNQRQVGDIDKAEAMDSYIEQSKTLETRLNDTYYEDQQAFMEIAHAMGFHNDNGDKL